MLRSIHVGVNDYPGTDMDLSGCVNDALDWAELIRKRGGTILTELHDSNATKKNICTAIAELLDVTSSIQDLAVISYSGHGSWLPDRNGDEVDGRDEALCPYDMDRVGLLTDDELFALMEKHKRPESRIVMISDSCHSGTVARFMGHPATTRRAKFIPPFNLPQFKRAGRKIEHQIELLARAGVARPWTVPGVVLLSGCSDREYSYDATINGRPRGAFTAAALTALAKVKVNGTYLDWYNLIRKALPSQEYPQTPQLTGPKDARLWPVFA